MRICSLRSASNRRIRWFSAAEEGTGLIASQEDFDAYPWPDAEDFNYSALDNISRYLPQGAKVIVNVGYIFMASWMLMGLETFCTTLADNPDLVQKVVDKVGTIQHRVMEIILDYDCVGAARMPDDMAYGRGQSSHLPTCGDIYSSGIKKSVNSSKVKICPIFCIPMVGCTKFWMTSSTAGFKRSIQSNRIQWTSNISKSSTAIGFVSVHFVQRLLRESPATSISTIH